MQDDSVWYCRNFIVFVQLYTWVGVIKLIQEVGRGPSRCRNSAAKMLEQGTSLAVGSSWKLVIEWNWDACISGRDTVRSDESDSSARKEQMAASWMCFGDDRGGEAGHGLYNASRNWLILKWTIKNQKFKNHTHVSVFLKNWYHYLPVLIWYLSLRTLQIPLFFFPFSPSVFDFCEESCTIFTELKNTEMFLLWWG